MKPVIKLRQSTIKNWLMCGRMTHAKTYMELPDPTSDAAFIGTCTHLAIETTLHGGSTDDALQAARDLFDNEWYDVRQITYKNPDTAWSWVEVCYSKWVDDIWPQLPAPMLDEHGAPMIEWQFNIPMPHLADTITDRFDVRLTGTADYVDETGCLWDWKTASKPYEQWEVDRFHIQPTVYTLAASHVLARTVTDWSYGVLTRNRNHPAQTVSTTRNEQDWRWLAQVVEPLVLLLASQDGHLQERWPINDQGWWCSAKWCPNWSNCKGAGT